MIQVTKDEIDKKREELKERRRRGESLTADMSRVLNMDPNKRYRGVNKDPKRVGRFKAFGYTLTKPPKSDEDPQWLALTSEENGAQEFGDQVLMETSRDNYIERLAVIEEKQAKYESEEVEKTLELLNKMARDGDSQGRGRLTKAHKDVAFVESKTKQGL